MKTVYQFFIVTSMLYASNSGHAKYSPIPVHQMVFQSTMTVYGTIVHTYGGAYNLKVEGVVSGEYAEVGDTILISKFKNWPCAVRWAPYQEGERVALFLSGMGKGWGILSGGGEGEMGIDSDDNVYIQGVPRSIMADDAGLTTSNPAPFRGTPIPLETFVDAVSKISACYSGKREGEYYYFSYMQMCTDGELSRYKSTSAFHKWLAESYA